VNIQIIVLLGIIIFLAVLNIIERWQSSKRESDLFDRLMAKSHDDYAMNKVRMSTTKPEYIGEMADSGTIDSYPVD